MKRVEVFFPAVDEVIAEIIIAELSALGYDPFWQDTDGLRAYIDEEKLDKDSLLRIQKKYQNLSPMEFIVQTTVPNEWDRVKEQDPEKKVIADRITILEPDSSDEAKTEFSLRLNAQMAFGDGNHPSTALCLEMMLAVDFKNKAVVDVGTGSGILAIMAEKMGAASVLAFDNNPWSVEVSKEMMSLNNSEKIQVKHAEIEEVVFAKGNYDIVLANLNMMVFNNEFARVAALVKKDGIMLVSGIMVKDEDSIEAMAIDNKLSVLRSVSKSNWVAKILGPCD